MHGNVRILALTSMTTGAYVSLLYTILQPFVVKHLGFSVAILGILVAAGARPGSLASSISQPFGGSLADIFGRKLLVIIGSAVGICSMVSFVAAAVTQSLVPLSIGYVLFGLALLGYPASQAAIAESVSMDPVKLNIAFSVVFFFTELPGAFIPFAADSLVASAGYAVLFVAAALLESFNLIVMFTQLEETHQSPDRGDGLPHVRRFSLRKAVSIPPGFVRIFAPFAMDAFFFGVCGSIIFGMWTQQFGLTQADIDLVIGALSVSIVVSQYLATRFLLKVGTRKSLALSEFLTVVVFVGWLLAPSVPALVLTGVVLGSSVAAWTPAQSTLLLTIAPAGERGSISGKLAAFRGLFGFPAPILGGLLFNSFGYYVPLTIGIVGESITIVAILRMLPHD